MGRFGVQAFPKETPMADGKAFLTPEQIRPLAERSDRMGWALLAHCWGMIFGPMRAFVHQHRAAQLARADDHYRQEERHHGRIPSEQRHRVVPKE